jgi:hypothetical protein
MNNDYLVSALGHYDYFRAGYINGMITESRFRHCVSFLIQACPELKAAIESRAIVMA